MIETLFVAFVIGGMIVTHRMSATARNRFACAALIALAALALAFPGLFPGGSGDWP